jgi:transposase
VLGLPYAVLVTTANVSDRDGAAEMFSPPDFHKVPTLRPELHKFVIMPKRWIVDRSFGWLDKCGRMWKNRERLIETSLNMVKLAFVSLPLKKY